MSESWMEPGEGSELEAKVAQGLSTLDAFAKIANQALPQFLKKAATLFLENIQLKTANAELQVSLDKAKREVGRLQALSIKLKIENQKLRGASGPVDGSDTFLKKKL